MGIFFEKHKKNFQKIIILKLAQIAQSFFSLPNKCSQPPRVAVGTQRLFNFDFDTFDTRCRGDVLILSSYQQENAQNKQQMTRFLQIMSIFKSFSFYYSIAPPSCTILTLLVSLCVCVCPSSWNFFVLPKFLCFFVLTI